MTSERGGSPKCEISFRDDAIAQAAESLDLGFDQVAGF
jgi:hypothetical protein